MNIKIQPRNDWNTLAEYKLNGCALSRLFIGNIPYIRISNFASSGECEALVKGAVREGFGSYRGVEPIINRIGNTVFEYNSISKHEYFGKNKALLQTQQRIFDNSFNPLQRFTELLKKCTTKAVRVATNSAGQPYYAGLIRRIEKGTLLHVDFAPGEQPEWEVAAVQQQLAWNLYLRVSHPQSGRTHVFNRQWQLSDQGKKEGIYGYNRLVVDGVEEAIFEPDAGDVVIFNTRNFHYVEPTEGERVTFTSAIGRTQSDELVLWS